MFKKVAMVVLVVFALVGVAFSGVFIAMQFGWLDVRGASSERDKFFNDAVQATGASKTVLAANTARAGATQPSTACPNVSAPADWNHSQEWQVVSAGLTKDAAIVNDVANKTGVPGRLIAAAVAPEQLRYFTSNRENFKRFFEPLKVLGSMTKFSLGVSGIKQDTAVEIEHNLTDPSSSFYPGPGYEGLITYSQGVSHDQVLFNRLTDEHNHYYAYLYTGLYLREVMEQWRRAGHDISAQPEISVTLFNIGFAHSQPKDSPQPGGAMIKLDNTEYGFGELGGLLYRSDQLQDAFPCY